MKTRCALFRRVMAASLAAMCATAGFARAGDAPAWPEKPIRMLIPYPPGGPTDLVGRALAQKLNEAFGQQIVIDNRGGGNGIIATEIVARAVPDGYTIFLATPGQLVTLPLLMSKLPFDTYRDFQPVTKVVATPQVLPVNPKLPVQTVAELVAHAKARPGQLSYGSVQTGGTGHLGMELLSQSTGIRMVHVPYKGTAPAMTDVISGQVQLMFTSLPTVSQHHRTGRVRIIATGAAKRTAAIPDVPTIGETIPGFELVTWYGLFVPRKTPRPIVDRLHRESVKALASPDVAQLFAVQGIEADTTTPEALEAYMRAESARWGKVIRTAGIKVE